MPDDQFVGAIVASITHGLRSGCSIYDTAIIASVSPFVLVSPGLDMAWYCVKPDEVTVVGQATPELTALCVARGQR